MTLEEMILNFLEKNWVNRVALWITIAGSLMVLYISYLLLFPKQIITVVQPYRILNSVIKQGDRLVYEVQYCVKKDVSFKVARQLINVDTGELWDVSDRVNNLKEGCIEENHDFLTPIRIDPGRYKMLASVNIRVNPLKFIQYEYETETFQVIESDAIIVIDKK